MKDEKSAPAQAFELFEKRAEAERRSYFGDMVRDNLNTLVNRGYTPEEAVDALFTQANGGKRVV